MKVARLTGVVVLGSSLFGASLGGYVGGVQIALSAVKVPTSLLATLAISFAMMHALNPRVRAAQNLELALTPIAVMSVVLAAGAPIMALMTLTMPNPSYTAYLFLILFGVAWGIAGGALGVRRLWRTRQVSGRVLTLWVILYQFVGAQCNWMLRPWIGDSREIDGLFSLTRNLRGNFYTAVWDAAGTLLGRLT